MKHEFGSLAKQREEQVIEWAMEHPMTSFSGDAVCKALFGKDRFPKGFPDKLLEAYRVACEDLRRKQILKGVHGNKGDMFYILGDMESAKAIIEDSE